MEKTLGLKHTNLMPPVIPVYPADAASSAWTGIRHEKALY